MNRIPAIATLLAAALVAPLARADGGYFSGTLGARASGRGGAVVGKADDVTAVSYNPAGLAKLEGTVVQLGNTFSYNPSSFWRAPTQDWGNLDPGTGQPRTVSFTRATNSKPWQALDPFLGVALPLGDQWGAGLAVYAPPGISRQGFPQDGGQRYQMLSRDSIILQYVASLAWKYGDIFGVGASAHWIHMPSLEYSLMIDGSIFNRTANPVTSRYDILATVKGSSLFTFNATLGTWYRPIPAIELAVSAQVVPTNIVANSTLSVAPVGSALTRVSLSRNGALANDVTLTLPLPMVFRGGIRYRHLEGKREVFDIELDVDYTTWSRAKRFVIESNGLVAKSQSETINIGTINIEKNWRDSLGIRLGGDYAVVPGRLVLRAGGYYESAVSDPAYASVDFATGPQVAGGLGASIFLGKVELAVAYQARVQMPVSVTEDNARGWQQVPGSVCQAPYTDTTRCHPEFLGQPAPAVNAGNYAAASHFLALDLLYRFGL